MRFPLALTIATLGFAGAAGLVAVAARAEDQPAPAPAAAPDPSDASVKIAALEARVEALRANVDYLRARDVALTNAVLSLGKTASELRTGTGQARASGFAAAAIPEASRSALLAALDTLAANLSSGLPAPSAAEVELKRRADDLRARAWPR